MSRQNGYTITIKAFVESPKNDFEKQAAAAVLMATITKTKTIPAEFLELATVEDVSAKYGSRASIHALLSTAIDAVGAEPTSETVSGETAAEAPPGRKRSQA